MSIKTNAKKGQAAIETLNINQKIKKEEEKQQFADDQKQINIKQKRKPKDLELLKK